MRPHPPWAGCTQGRNSGCRLALTRSQRPGRAPGLQGRARARRRRGSQKNGRRGSTALPGETKDSAPRPSSTGWKRGRRRALSALRREETLVAGMLAGQKRQRTAALRDAIARSGSPRHKWLGSNRLRKWLRILFLTEEKVGCTTKAECARSRAQQRENANLTS